MTDVNFSRLYVSADGCREGYGEKAGHHREEGDQIPQAVSTKGHL